LPTDNVTARILLAGCLQVDLSHVLWRTHGRAERQRVAIPAPQLQHLGARRRVDRHLGRARTLTDRKRGQAADSIAGYFGGLPSALNSFMLIDDEPSV
jgi:hypothetical protein